MDFLIDGFISAILLAASLDTELFCIVWVSLKVSCIATLFAGMMGGGKDKDCE